MATRSLPQIGDKNWADPLNRYLAVIQNEKGAIYNFANDAERLAYFDNSTIFKTLDDGKTCIMKDTGKILIYDLFETKYFY